MRTASHGKFRRRLARLEERPCSPAALVAEAHRLEGILQAGGQLPTDPGRLTRVALTLVAAARALKTLMPGGGAYEEEARLAEGGRRVEAEGQDSAGDDADDPEPDPRDAP